MRQTVLLFLSYREQGSERLESYPKSHSTGELGMIPSPPLTTALHSLPTVWAYLSQSPPAPSPHGGYGFYLHLVSMQAPGSPTSGALMTYMPPTPAAPDQPIQPGARGKFQFSLQYWFALYNHKTDRNPRAGLGQMIPGVWTGAPHAQL